MKRKFYIATVLILFCMLLSVLINLKNNFMVYSSKKELPIYSVDTKDKNISITFDTSWGNDNTESIIGILNQYNIKATFFVIGKWAEQFPDEVRDIVANGNEIGNHSYTHPDMTRLNEQTIISEIDKTDNIIKKLTGTNMNLFRVPSGEYNNLVINTVKNKDLYCIQWNVDSIDWRNDGADIEYDRVMKNVKPGAIILFHNNGKYTPYNLPRIIKNLQIKGYKFVIVSDLIYKNQYFINNEGKQIKNKNIVN